MPKRRRNSIRRKQQEDEQSTAVPPPAHHSSPQEHIGIRTRYSTQFLTKRGPNRTPLRSPIRNVQPIRKLRSIPCVSSASSPFKNNDDVAEDSDQFSPQMDDCMQEDENRMPYKKEKANAASSFNYTEVVEKVANYYIDPDEAGSKDSPALVTVNGYTVKEEFAPLVRSIISRYGDICKDCIQDSLKDRSWLIQKVCGIFLDMEKTESVHVTSVEVKSMMEKVEFLDRMRIDVKWLQERLDQINDVFRLSKGYSVLKDALTNNLMASERKNNELEVKKNELEALKDELYEIGTERSRINKAIRGSKAKIKAFYRQSLVNGLL